MPFISTPNPNNPGATIEGIGSMLFPDPSKIAQAQYQGAHARKAEAETSQLNQQSIARQAVTQTLAEAVRNPSQETIGAAVSTALQAGYDPAQVVRGALAAHQAAGSPGGPRMSQTLADTVISMTGGTPFANTQTGFNTAQTNETKRAQIAIQPGMAQVGLNRDIANNNRVFVDQAGNRRVVPMGQPIADGLMPEDTSRAFGTANIGIQPAMEQQRRETQKYANTRDPYTDPNTGETQYLPPGQTPGPSFMPTDRAGPIMQSQIGAAPGMITANAPKPYAVPGNGPSGVVTQYYRPGETPPTGAVPLDAANPLQTGIGVGMFGAPQRINPNAQVAGQDLTITPADGGSGTGLGGIISGSGTPTPSQAAPAPAPGGGVPPVTPAGGSPAPRNDMFGTLAANAGAGIGNQTPEKIGEASAWEAAITAHEKRFNKENNKGIETGLTGDYSLSTDAHSALVSRASQLLRDRGNRTTFNNPNAALEAAWAEQEPTWKRDGSWVPGGKGSFLRPGPKQGGDTGPVAPTGQAPSPPAGTPRAAPPPVPAAPAGISDLISGYGATTGTSGQVAAQAAPVTAQAAPATAQAAPPAPVNPAERKPGVVYTTPNGRQFMWTGQGWVP